ncbi:hypothetical protein ASF49_09835 [Methylobacterium sp. Leaf104]|uniref:hypothetical protein n=1 Tax=Methylobacterium TaxID=407 RepID=UPI0007020EB5|nr:MULTISPECIES: hypothetical protein [Methylobacterium]KQP31731.1 hypothetical protein ASF49_09835 [Methylobacterium sp. Leaf104]MCI9880644.1 hypothetical protein [Methylobacterium goesingense]
MPRLIPAFLCRACAIAGSLIALAPAIGVPAAGVAAAQEPLFIRIRPGGEPALGLGGGGAFDEAAAQAARARSEAVWQRAEARSRIAIASVCTGCLTALPPAVPPVPAPAPSVRTDAGGPTPIAADPAAAPLPPLAQADAP